MQGINKWYGAYHALRDIDLAVAPGERVIICGPSGSGKSTMIRCINRLEEHQAGELLVDGIEVPASQAKIHGGVNLTTWFAVLVIIVLAEVFREGARLRRDAELTI